MTCNLEAYKGLQGLQKHRQIHSILRIHFLPPLLLKLHSAMPPAILPKGAIPPIKPPILPPLKPHYPPPAIKPSTLPLQNHIILLLLQYPTNQKTMIQLTPLPLPLPLPLTIPIPIKILLFLFLQSLTQEEGEGTMWGLDCKPSLFLSMEKLFYASWLLLELVLQQYIVYSEQQLLIDMIQIFLSRYC
jgi:hypothetical protein